MKFIIEMLQVHNSLTFAEGQWVAPQAIHTALGPSSSMQHVASVACKVNYVIEVKLTPVSPSISWVSRMATGNCCY